MGRAIAIALAQGGADVLINYRDDAAAAQSAADAIVEAGRRAHVVRANVGESAEVDRLVAACVSELGPPMILVNNAGIGKRVLDVADLDIDTWNDTIAINLTAPFLMAQAVVPYMRTAGWGRIINISSTAAQTGGSVGPHYAASKAGIIGLTHGYASKLVKEGITVNAIAMAQIETDMLRSATAVDPSRIPIGRFGTVDEVAAVATMLVDNAYMTGQTISLNGGMYYTS